MASEIELKAYEEELAKCTINAHTMGGLQLDKLPGPEALEEAGKTDGQTRVVRQVLFIPAIMPALIPMLILILLI